MRRALILGLAGAAAFAVTSALGEGSYTPEATRCGKDIQAMYAFWEARIANTPDPQTTLETGLYTKHDGTVVTYAAELRQEAGYEVTWC